MGKIYYTGNVISHDNNLYAYISTARIEERGGKVLQIRRSLVQSQLLSLEFFIDKKYFRSQYCPGVGSASNRNEY